MDESENADAAKKAPLFIPKDHSTRQEAKLLDRTLSEKTQSNEQIDQNVFSYNNMSVEAYFNMETKGNLIFSGNQLKQGTENIPEFFPS